MDEKLTTLPLKKLENYLNAEKLEKLHSLKTYLDDMYYNTGDSTVDDSRYDMLKDILKKRDPGTEPVVGAKLRTGENRVKIPFWLGSADKITPEEPDELKRYLTRNSSSKYVISEKLDGVSCLLVYDGKTKLYTRGDGVVGADISYLTSFFKSIPSRLPKIAVRGELIIKKEVFEEKYRGKSVNGRQYKNSRNMVAGLIGGKTAREGLSDITFVVYEIVGDSMPKPSTQLQKLDSLGFTVVKYTTEKKISIESLSKQFLTFKEESEYEIDGLIIEADQPYDRNTSGNPEYMFAFKMLLDEAIHEALVLKVEWGISKWSQLKPVVILEPVVLNDVTISRVTAHNAKYVEENSLGPGAIIRVTRSKDVIPYIVEVVKPADSPQMPDIPYSWDKNHVNVLAKKFDEIMCIKLISGFFAKLGIKFVSEATVTKMFTDGLDNLLKIVGASKERLLRVPEFQEKSAERIYTNIHTGLQNIKLSTLLGASGVFGYSIGVRRVDALLLDIPDLLTVYKTKTKNQMLKTITDVEGFSNIMAEKVYSNLKYADLFVQKIRKHVALKTEVRVSADMKGQKIVMTGFRDKAMEEKITERGGKVTSTVTGNTTALVVSIKTGKLTGKLEKADKLGVPIYSREEFWGKFLT